jgi:hypothetical protein
MSTPPPSPPSREIKTGSEATLYARYPFVKLIVGKTENCDAVLIQAFGNTKRFGIERRFLCDLLKERRLDKWNAGAEAISALNRRSKVCSFPKVLPHSICR